jgi:uncharacterized delta-60 repeat protein
LRANRTVGRKAFLPFTTMFAAVALFLTGAAQANAAVFNPGTGPDNGVTAISAQTDGKLVVVGYFAKYNGITRNYIVRADADGADTLTAFPTPVSDIEPSTYVTSTAIQSDGKILIGGNFTNVGNVPYIARLNSNGTVDATFASATPPPDLTVNVIALQGDSRILIGGAFTGGIGRLDSSGNADPTFNGGSGANGTVNAIAVQPDGKILIVGDFTHYNGTARSHIARLNSDGSLDATFDPGTGADSAGSSWVSAIALQSDGRILIGGNFSGYNGTTRNNIARLNSDGSLDSGFASGSAFDNYVSTIVLQPDGKIVAGGVFATFNGVSRNAVARINVDGSLDTAFNPLLHFGDWVRALFIQSDGRIVVGGSQFYYSSVATRYLTRLNTDGTFDVSTSLSQTITFPTTFPVGRRYADWTTNVALSQTLSVSATGGASGNPVVFSSSDPTIATVSGTTFNGTTSTATVTIIGAGTVTIAANQPRSLAYAAALPVTKTLTIGKVATKVTVTTPKLVRPNGVPNPVFVPSYSGFINGDKPGTALTGAPSITTTATAVSPGGSYPITVAAGTLASQNYDFTYVSNTMTVYAATSVSLTSASYQALENAGAANIVLSRAGGTDSSVTAKVTLQGGSAASPGDYLFTPGALTASFNAGADNNVYAVAAQPDGKIVIAGSFTQVNSTLRNRVARLNADGTLDTTFSDPNVGAGTVQAVAVQSDGKILLGGNFPTVGGVNRNGIARLNSNGTLDVTFNPGSGLSYLGSTFSFVYALAVQPDGKVLLGGAFDGFNGTTRNYLARVDSAGTLDPSFAPSFDNPVNAVAVQADGRIVVGGDFTTVNGAAPSRIVRLNPDGSVDTTFGVGTGADATVAAVAVTPDGKILIGGTFSSVAGTGLNRIGRLNTDGTVDSGFAVGAGASGIVRTVVVQPDGPVAIGGDFSSVGGATRNGIARLKVDGSIDTSFDPGTGTTLVYGMAMLPNGKFAVGGKFTSPRSHIMVIDGDLFATWPANDGTNKTISLPVVFNPAAQSDRTVNFGLSAYGGATTVGSISSSLTIQDVPPIAQTITFNALSAVTYGAAPFTLTATGGASGNPVTFASDNPSVATVSGSTVTIVGAGTANITTNQAGGINGLNAYTAAVPVVRQLIVNKAVLTVTVQNASRPYGMPDPALTASITGFVNNDTPAVVTGVPDLSTTATLFSTGGSYPIIANVGTLATTDNYAFAFENGTLTVGAAPSATITPNISSPTKSTSATFTIGGSQVASYSYQVDGGGYSGDIPVSTGINLSNLGEGKHTLDVIGKNSAGAPQATPTSFSWTVDVTGPELSVSALPDQGLTGDDTINVAGVATDPTTSVTGVTVNGVLVTVHPDGSFSQAVALVPGSNGLVVVATDAVGNQTTDTRSVTYDQTAPKLAIAAPADNISVRNAVLDLSGTMGTGVFSVGVKHNGADQVPVINGTEFSASLSLQPGINTIELSASDGTRISVAKRTVSYYIDGPTVEIISPAQDLTTSNATLTIQGTVADATMPAVSISFEGQNYSPIVTNGTFTQALSLSFAKTYPMVVTVTDGSAQTTVQRNVIYQPPSQPSPTIDLGSVSGARGKTTTVPVKLTNVQGTSVVGATVDIGFDPTLITPSAVSLGAASTAAGGKTIQGSIVTSGVYRVTVGGGQSIIGNGVLASVTFNVSSSVTISSASPTVAASLSNTSSAKDVSGNNVTANGSSGMIHIISKPGDANGDGVVKANELQGTINMILGITPVSIYADVNGDGVVKANELQGVINAILGL